MADHLTPAQQFRALQQLSLERRWLDLHQGCLGLWDECPDLGDHAAALLYQLQAEAEAALGLHQDALVTLQRSIECRPNVAARVAWLSLAPLPDGVDTSNLERWLRHTGALVTTGHGELLLRLLQHRLSAQPLLQLRRELWAMVQGLEGFDQSPRLHHQRQLLARVLLC